METPAQTVALPGTTRFELIRKLGRGGMGDVYEAFDRERNARVALKTLSQLTPESLRRFKNEFRSLQDLQHPNLVHLDELLEVDGLWFFTMELVRGTNFLHHVRPPAARDGDARDVAARASDGPSSMSSFEVTKTVDTASSAASGQRVAAPGVGLDDDGFDEPRLRAGLRQVAHGLMALHAAHKVHRDVKPANILVEDDGRVVILDFGLVAERGQLDKRAMGTVAYMAPEQITDASVGPAADWYAVGVTLYRALTGAFPFSGSHEEVLERKVHYDPTPPGALSDGVPPDLDALCMELLRRDPARRPGGAEILARLGEPVDDAAAVEPITEAAPAFVGRERELGELRAAFARMTEAPGHAVAVLVHGESGVGKSALVRHFLDTLSGSRTVMLSGRCYERESVPYKAVDQVMEALARHVEWELRHGEVELRPERLGLLAEIFPTFASLQALALRAGQPADDEARPVDPMQSRSAAFTAIRDLLDQIARRQPVVIAIDDLQWADADSLRLLGEVMAPPDAPPLLLCATVRMVGDASGLSRLSRHLGDDVRAVAVTRLPRDDARALAQQLLSSHAVPGAGPGERAAWIDAVAAEADGHPLFLDALLRHRLLHPDAAAPVRLDEALLARTQSLDAGSRDVLTFVCLAGGPVQQEACAHAIGVPFGDFTNRVATLRAADLVRTHGIRRRDPIEPYHDRVREAVSAGLDGATRRDVHGRLARALEASGEADPEQLAVHLHGSGDDKRAARYFARAAEQARASLAFDRAARLYQRALELDPGAQTQRLRVALADALGLSGRGAEAAERYLAAAAAETDPEQALVLRRLAAGQYMRAGRVAASVGTFGDLLAGAGFVLPHSRLRAMVAFVAERIRLKRRGLDFTPRDESALPADVVHRMNLLLGLYPLGLADMLRGHRFQMRNLRLCLDAGVPARIARALPPQIVYLATLGDAAGRELDAHVALAERLAAGIGDPVITGTVAGATGVAYCILGRWRDALAQCDAAERILRDECGGAQWELGQVHHYGLRARFFLGLLGEVRQRIWASLREADDRGDLFLATNLRVGLAMAHACLADDDPATALALSANALREWSTEGVALQHLYALQGDVSVDLYTGDIARADQRIAETWPKLAKAMYLRIESQRILCKHLRARVAIAGARASAGGKGGDRDRRLAAAEKDAHAIEGEATRWGAPLGRLLEAGIAARRDRPDAAVEHLVAAELLLANADMGLFAAAARRHRGRIIGGDEGAALVAEADAWMTAQTIARPERFAELLVPGFEG